MTIATDKTEPSPFEKLVGELDVLVKAEPKCDGDDKKIKAAAGEGDDDLDEDGKPKAKKEGKPMTKALKVTLEDGTVVDAEDGSELIKALTDQLTASDAHVEKLETDMTKALGDAVTLIKGQSALLKSQGETIATLEEKIGKLSNQGAGRKAVVTLHDKKTSTEELTKSEGINLNDFMAKATSKFNEGKITGLQLATFESMANRGLQPDPQLAAQVMA